ncbi:hypothetical protein CDL15_Pgr003423 [Punica granatum]|uniref:25S rRNA (uridine-N(3))-methyltransferase BMT5-like domain-containing protein n=1 Tax=Punica granatum TaxID=22663 RepID=A0A218X417_PUNGR|nr:hypothetical protein CDL15_Pgr003423 [Punica granatum]
MAMAMAMGEERARPGPGEEEKWLTHYSSNHSILLVGEGDFSFSKGLAMAFGSASNIHATSYDTYGIRSNHFQLSSCRLLWKGRQYSYDQHA